jgi:hypothetical protein
VACSCWDTFSGAEQRRWPNKIKKKAETHCKAQGGEDNLIFEDQLMLAEELYQFVHLSNVAVPTTHRVQNVVSTTNIHGVLDEVRIRRLAI